ncbi:MAG: hypothetical protein JNJ98_10450, partial [Gemmatimonadetes bacterium]|nr:hypothetical protein [Gemmatimonadota bacterium]
MRLPALSALLVLAGCATATRIQTPQYDAFAVKFGALANFRVRGLIAGADTARRIDATLMVWPLRASNGDIVMVDA